MKTKTIVRINAQIEWAFGRAQSGNWIADCDDLGLTVQSTERYVDLTEDISDALNLLFRDLLESSELDAYLRAHGWSVSGPLPIQASEAVFDVPFALLPRTGAVGSAEHLHQ